MSGVDVDLVRRVEKLEEAIRSHRKAVRRIFGTDYGKPKQAGSKSADGRLWAVLGDDA